MSGLLRLSRSEAVIAALLAAAMMATPEADAGDAVVIGYNADGIWTSVTYYCSGTPKGGADYKERRALARQQWPISRSAPGKA